MQKTLTETGLILFMKAPENAKRRMADEIGDLANVAAEKLWCCAHEDMLEWKGPIWYSPAEEEDASWLTAEIDPTPRICVQARGNLGQRINHVDRELRSGGVEKLIVIGTDCPALDNAYLRQAARALQYDDVVLGPSSDGGVVLMGTRQPWPDLSTLPWSTDSLYRALRDRLRAENISVTDLDRRSDIDTVEDLLTASVTLQNDHRASRRELVSWITQHRKDLTIQR